MFDKRARRLIRGARTRACRVETISTLFSSVIDNSRASVETSLERARTMRAHDYVLRSASCGVRFMKRQKSGKSTFSKPMLRPE